MTSKSVPQDLNQENRLRLLVESVIDYAIYMLDPDGVVASWNPGAQRLFGYSADEIVGKSLALIVPADRASEAGSSVCSGSTSCRSVQLFLMAPRAPKRTAEALVSSCNLVTDATLAESVL